ncbi:hypothetical protein PHMEG_0009767 [Phytophthora megakarya]|uniref:Chromo domain-containing protein n=1 Tax=Phytophthora megakarya TaxID=4795 RepID=A0A225WFP4_9STRA|nr:hypothetical protein PHMEG_0009767 [Phytophthora megakarya]
MDANVIKFQNKLAMKWQGPKKTVSCVSDWIFDVQNLVEAFEGIRRNAASRKWEVQVKWMGLDELENTW